MQELEREQQRIQQEQQLILEMERRRQEIEQAIKRPQIEAPIVEESVDFPEGGGCIEVRSLEIAGNTVFSTLRINEAFEPYRDQCLTLGRINGLLQDITNLYLNAGYITSRAFMTMPQNRLKEGVLEIRIVEGRISAVDGLKNSERWTAFPGIIDQVLNLRDIEQGLEQINRLPSNRATMDIKPSEEKEGQSDVVISNAPQGRFRFSAYTDNAGSENTGVWRVGGRAAADNILGLNEQFNFNYAKAPSNNSKQQDSNSYSGSLSVPFGYWTYTYSLSQSDYRSSFLLPLSGERYYFYGDSLNHSFNAERIISRGQSYKAAISAGVTYKDTKNYSEVADIKIKNESSSRTLAILSIEAPITLYLPASVLYLKPGFHQGTRWMGALDDSREPYSQRAQYGAFKLYGYHSFRYGWASVTTSVDIQYTTHELFSSEAFFIGGEYSVRGFKDDSIQGDKGFTLRNDLSIDLNRLLGAQSEFLAIFTPGVFFDYGYVDSNNQYLGYADLAGAGVKCGIDWKIFQASATYAVVLHKEDWMRDNTAWYFYGGLNFRF